MALLSSGVSSKSSVWPGRNQRRHEATQVFNEQVLSSLSSISSRLGEIDRKIEIMSAAVASEKDMKLCELVTESANRIDKIEMLLFRTSLQDFESLDKELAQMLPSIQAHRNIGMHQRVDALLADMQEDEPEKELTPAKHRFQVSSSPEVEDRCCCFDISSKIDETSDADAFDRDFGLYEADGEGQDSNMSVQHPVTLEQIKNMLHQSHSELLQNMKQDTSLMHANWLTSRPDSLGSMVDLT